MTSATLEVRNLRTHFFTRAGVVKAVDDVSFSIARGQVLGLVGESGSGKTVTGFSIIGLVDPPGRIAGGAILYQGQDLAKLTEREMRRLRGNRIAMIFQDPMMTLNPVLRIDTQMIEAVRAHADVSHAEARVRSRDALGLVGIPSPDERLSSYPHQFSGGMRQRVAIAIALLHHPDLLIADEPTTALDVTIQAQILSEVQNLAATYGTALIWITHDLSVIAGLADDIAVMYAGRIVETGSAEAVLDRPLHPYTHGLIGSVPSRNQRGEKLRQIPGMTPGLLDLPQGCAFRTRCPRADTPLRTGARTDAAATGPHHALLPSAAVAARMNRDAAPQSPIRTAGMTTPPIIELRGVSKRFGPTYDAAARLARSWTRRFGGTPKNETVRAVDHVDLAVARGEVVGLVGESGCGKSTLGRMVAGILPPSDGQVLFKGQDIATLPPDRARDARLKVQMIFQDPYASLNPRLRVADIVGEAPLVHGLVSRADFDTYLDAQLQRAGLDPSSKRRYPHQFSGGQRQRIGIARALAVQPEFLVCDEAVAALDVSIQAQILNLFMDLRRDLDLTYLFISHDLGVVEHLSDRVLIMYLGRIVERATAEEVFARPNHPYTQALLAEVPRIDARKRRFTAVKGEIPSPLNPPSGCHFHPRCPHAMPRCAEVVPPLREIAPGHHSACHLNDRI